MSGRLTNPSIYFAVEEEKSQQRYEQKVAEDEVFEHDLSEHYNANNRRICGDSECVYCLTIADRLSSVEPLSEALWIEKGV